MPQITHVGRVMVPVADQDAAIAFYTGPCRWGSFRDHDGNALMMVEAQAIPGA